MGLTLIIWRCALVIGVIIAWYRFSSDRTRWRQLYFLLYILAAFVAIGLTGSRGGLLALLGAVLTFTICADLRRRMAMLAGATALLILTAALPSSVTWRLSTTTDEISHGTLDGRKALWEQGVSLFEEHPLNGLGVGGVEGAWANSPFNAVHNTPLEILVEVGVVGFGLYYGGLAHSIDRVRRVAGQEGTALVAVCAAWFVGTFSISWDVYVITWFIFAMLLSACSAQRARRVSNKPDRVLNVGALTTASCP